jgi:transcription elongation factor Elf1
MKEKIPFACPVCGRKTNYFLDELKENALLTCPSCKLKLTLHGHMWEDVQREIKNIANKKEK